MKEGAKGAWEGAKEYPTETALMMTPTVWGQVVGGASIGIQETTVKPMLGIYESTLAINHAAREYRFIARQLQDIHKGYSKIFDDISRRWDTFNDSQREEAMLQQRLLGLEMQIIQLQVDQLKREVPRAYQNDFDRFLRDYNMPGHTPELDIKMESIQQFEKNIDNTVKPPPPNDPNNPGDPISPGVEEFNKGGVRPEGQGMPRTFGMIDDLLSDPDSPRLALGLSGTLSGSSIIIQSSMGGAMELTPREGESFNTDQFEQGEDTPLVGLVTRGAICEHCMDDFMTVTFPGFGETGTADFGGGEVDWDTEASFQIGGDAWQTEQAWANDFNDEQNWDFEDSSWDRSFDADDTWEWDSDESYVWDDSADYDWDWDYWDWDSGSDWASNDSFFSFDWGWF